MTDTTDRARAITHTSVTCKTKNKHSLLCDTLTAAIRAYGDQRAAEERKACAEVAGDVYRHTASYTQERDFAGRICPRIAKAILERKP